MSQRPQRPPPPPPGMRPPPPPPIQSGISLLSNPPPSLSSFSSFPSYISGSRADFDTGFPSLRLPGISPFRQKMFVSSDPPPRPALVPKVLPGASTTASLPEEEPSNEFVDFTANMTKGQLPAGWGVGETPQGRLYYFRLGSTATVWEHPNEQQFKLFEEKMQSVTAFTPDSERAAIEWRVREIARGMGLPDGWMLLPGIAVDAPHYAHIPSGLKQQEHPREQFLVNRFDQLWRTRRGWSSIPLSSEPVPPPPPGGKPLVQQQQRKQTLLSSLLGPGVDRIDTESTLIPPSLPLSAQPSLVPLEHTPQQRSPPLESFSAMRLGDEFDAVASRSSGSGPAPLLALPFRAPDFDREDASLVPLPKYMHVFGGRMSGSQSGREEAGDDASAAGVYPTRSQAQLSGDAAWSRSLVGAPRSAAAAASVPTARLPPIPPPPQRENVFCNYHDVFDGQYNRLGS